MTIIADLKKRRVIRTKKACGPSPDTIKLTEEEKSAIIILQQNLPVVVSATRTETEVDKAPADVSIVNREDLEKLNFDRIDDAIRYEAGVFDGKLRGLPSANRLCKGSVQCQSSK